MINERKNGLKESERASVSKITPTRVGLVMACQIGFENVPKELS